tara:strand:+ start:387 stop:578 length:192 start_codon:yes stop_codon:yes gene_type:complete
MCIHIYPLFTTRTLSGVTYVVFEADVPSVSVYKPITFFAFEPLLADCFQMVLVTKLGFESPIA